MLVCVGAGQCSKSVGFHGVGIAEQTCSVILSGEGREIERALKGARLPPASGARARGEMDAGGLACAAIGTCLRTFFLYLYNMARTHSCICTICYAWVRAQKAYSGVG